MKLLQTAGKTASMLRPWVRDLGASVLQYTTLLDPGRWARDKLSIVTFHRVLPAEQLRSYPIPNIAVTPEELDWLLDLFIKHYTPGTLAEMATRFTLGDRPAKPLLAVTFDDGQRDNHTHARPVLAAHAVHASFFVVGDATEHNQTLWHDRVAYAMAALWSQDRGRAGALLSQLGLGLGNEVDDPPNAAVARAKLMTPGERERFVAELETSVSGPVRPAWDGMMTWHELQELHAEGHEIGSHSRSHAILPLVSDAQLHDEVAGSRVQLRQRLGFEIESFCYPNGDCDPRVVAAVERAGYRHAVTTRYGINAAGSSPYLWRRCDMQSQHARTHRGAFSEGRMLLRMSGWLPGMT
jgi:peptidoglycan/xylan/chitin deacetylase (PgdA/CDA1 family)